MLKGIPSILSPDLVKGLMEMGHGDEIVIADGHFPAARLNENVIRCDGHQIVPILTAILQHLPLDTYVDKPVALMDVLPGDSIPNIWEQYVTILKQEGFKKDSIKWESRYDFYERAKSAFAVIATSERALYANVILTKGIVSEE
ncbi:RbsD/FucU family protein [Halalkalibacter sp. AB-rgal2]|uniref:RbsD/FucU family protein n=1 Tax=Halalkalibacter sp. AB-rgal2 TaxID=3242695 RepID=UPI00359E4500